MSPILLTFGLKPHAAVAAGSMFALLGAITLALPIAKRLKPGGDTSDLLQRAIGWWLVLGSLLVALLLGPLGTLALFAVVSWVGLGELLRAAGLPYGKAVRVFAALAIAGQYALVGLDHFVASLLFVPLACGLAVPVLLMVDGGATDYVRRVGTLQLALLLAVFCLSQMPALMLVPGAGTMVAGGGGLILYALILTQLNDVAQYYWGKVVGRTPIVPDLSPKKTWGGFLGGVLTMGLLGNVLAPALTPLAAGWGTLLGAAIAVAGFLGDLTVSAIKRDAGVKDLGQLLPGFGGVMDRVDSLVYAAPLLDLVLRLGWLH